MSEQAPIVGSQEVELRGDTTAEAKRRAARRRFLGRSAAAGSGLAIVTLYHTRALGWYSFNHKLISSVEACASLQGNLVKDAYGRPELFQNSITGIKDRYKCEY